MRHADPASAPGRPARWSDRIRRVAEPLARRDSRELLAIAVEALSRYKLRTSLSVLGVVLGVAAVIAMMSVSDGARAEALKQVELLGLDNLVARSRMPGFAQTPGARVDGLTAGDVAHVLELVPLAKSASALIEKYLPVSYAGHSVVAPVLGVESSYGAILRLRLDHGRFLSSVEDRSGTRVCVLGGPLSKKLFGFRDAVGEFVRAQGIDYQVVGVLSEQGADPGTVGTLAWRDMNQVVVVPLTALSGQSVDVTPGQPVDEIWLQAEQGDRVEDVAQVLTETLARVHGGAAGFEIVVPRELLAQRYQTQRTFSVVVGSVAALALIVGGIGIMNIMLTSVVERTHEIGIRRTVGATRRDVTAQFLTESLLMTLGGGVIGIVIGVAVSWGITAYAGWSTHVSAVAVALAFAVSCAVGLVFGLYPAIQAARLEPVDALRYE